VPNVTPTMMGNGISRQAGLDLDPVDSPVGRYRESDQTLPSFDAPELTYVIPGHPEQRPAVPKGQLR